MEHASSASVTEAPLESNGTLQSYGGASYDPLTNDFAVTNFPSSCDFNEHEIDLFGDSGLNQNQWYSENRGPSETSGSYTLHELYTAQSHNIPSSSREEDSGSKGDTLNLDTNKNPTTVQENIIVVPVIKPTTLSTISTNGVDVEDEGEVITAEDFLKLNLPGYLQSTSEGIALINIIKNHGQLTKNSRSRLTRLIIKRELDEAIVHAGGRELYSSDFTPYSNVGGIRIAPKGKLYDNYSYTKSKLRDDGVLANSTSASLTEKSISQTPISTENQNDPAIAENLQSLQTEVVAVKILREYWDSTYEKRRAFLIKDRLSVSDYFHMFPYLSNDAYAIELLSNDFEKPFPTKAQSLTQNWPQLKAKLITLINELKNIKDVDDLALRKLIPNVTSSNQDAILLHLMPYLTGHPYIDIPEDEQVEKVGAKRKRKITKRRATPIQNRESFFMLSATVGNIDEAIRVQKNKLLQLKLPLQPLPIFVGTLSDIVDTYVIVDNIKYRTANPIAAIDLAFKIFHVVDCQYPEPSLFSWLLIKQFGYGLPTSESNLPLTMKVLLGDLKK